MNIKKTLFDAIWVILQHTLPSKTYLRLRYFAAFKRFPNLNNPVTFTEKLQWLKIHGVEEYFTTLVDKILVKDYVGKKIGKEYIIPTIVAADSVDKLNIADLPSKFVLKTNHDSGTAIICRDKQNFDFKSAKSVLKKALHTNYYLKGREKPYKSVKRMVFAEEYIEHQGDLVDYKFFCFGGDPRIVKIDYDRETSHHANYYDINMRLLPFFKISSKPEIPKEFKKPANYEKMVEIAHTLSANIPFVRVDLYNVQGIIFFGEITFYPSSGFEPLTDNAWDKKLGEWIILPEQQNK